VLAVKRGHHDPPSAVVVGAVDRQEAVAQEWDQIAEARLPPVELLRVLDRNEGVRLRADHEDPLGVKQAHGEDRSVFALERQQDREGVTGEGEGSLEVEVTRAGRELALEPSLNPEVARDPPDRALGDAGRRRDGRH
jgi:hypothetical protein